MLSPALLHLVASPVNMTEPISRILIYIEFLGVDMGELDMAMLVGLCCIKRTTGEDFLDRFGKIVMECNKDKLRKYLEAQVRISLSEAELDYFLGDPQDQKKSDKAHILDCLKKARECLDIEYNTPLPPPPPGPPKSR